MEIVDEHNEPTKTPGIAGSILVTNLVNRLMPFVRYPVGDHACWTDHQRGQFQLLGRDQSVGVRLAFNSMSYVDIRRAVATALRCKEFGKQSEGLQVVVERFGTKDCMCLRIAGDFEVSSQAAAAAIYDIVVQLNPPFEMHVKRQLIGPIEVVFYRMAELEFSPLSGKVIEVIDRRTMA